MKKILILFLFFTNLCFSQVVVEKVDINKLDITFCEIVGSNIGFFKSKIIINVDYGQKLKFGESQLIEDSAGKAMVFNSMVDALNFMEKNGWEFVNNYVITINTGTSTQNVYHFLLRKKMA